MQSLLRKTALVTGASRGIGRAIALALADAGAHVLVHYGRSQAEADAVVALIREKGGQADALGTDLSQPNGGAALAQQVSAALKGHLDIVVLNAGVSKAAPIAAYTPEEVDALYATNVRGPFFLVQQLIPLLVEGSNIVAVTSAVARMVIGKPALENPSILAYASTKGALESLVKMSVSITPGATALTRIPRGPRIAAQFFALSRFHVLAPQLSA